MIYFDNNATTRPLPEVVDAMAECLRDEYANPSSVHQFGQSVRHRIERARFNVADLLGASPKEIVFTSGGTESTNMAIRGAVLVRPDRRRIVTTSTEHSATLRVLRNLDAEDYDVVYVGVDANGTVNESQWRDAINDNTAIVSLCHVNNETGAVADVPSLARAAAERGAIVHIDAVQSVGKIPLDVGAWPAHLVTVSAHKYHGPKGVGALYVRRRTRVAPLILGGTQERALRGGTENVSGIVGMGVASEAAHCAMDAVERDVRRLRDRFEARVLEKVPAARVVAGQGVRIHSTSNIAFPGLLAEAILILLSEAGICASAGAACSSGSLEPSHVLRAMGIPDELAHGAVRFSFSKFNTSEEVDAVVSALAGIDTRLRHLGGEV